jgi:hypothetical protein
MRIVPSLAALLLGVATALVVGCGANDRIPSSDASRVENALNDVSAQFRAGNCQGAEQAVARARGALLNLPSSVDSGLRSRLRSGVDNLAERVPQTCGTQTQTQQTDTGTTDTGTTDTGTTDTGTTDTGTTDTGTTDTGTTDTGTTDTGTEPPSSTPTTGTTTGTTTGATGGATPGGGGG